MRKPFFCICENKDADQLRGNREADQRLCFRHTDSAIPLLSEFQNFKPLAIFSDCTARFVSDLVGNHEDRFSHNKAHLMKLNDKRRLAWNLSVFIHCQVEMKKNHFTARPQST